MCRRVLVFHNTPQAWRALAGSPLRPAAMLLQQQAAELGRRQARKLACTEACHRRARPPVKEELPALGLAGLAVGSAPGVGQAQHVIPAAGVEVGGLDGAQKQFTGKRSWGLAMQREEQHRVPTGGAGPGQQHREQH